MENAHIHTKKSLNIALIVPIHTLKTCRLGGN